METKWSTIKPDLIEEGTQVTVGLVIKHPSIQPEVHVFFKPKKGKPTLLTFEPAAGVSGVIEICQFTLGKKKDSRFPYELDSFEVNMGLVKAHFKKRKD